VVVHLILETSSLNAEIDYEAKKNIASIWQASIMNWINQKI